MTSAIFGIRIWAPLGKFLDPHLNQDVIAGSLESANSSILAARRHFKEVVGKNQDFIIMSLVNPSNLIGCGGDI